MRFNVLAIDYDGTMAEGGRANPDVVEALREARVRGVVIVLVTGRILADLERVFPQRDLFDVIVAENGAVLAFPNGQERILGRAPSPLLMNDLWEAGISWSFGVRDPDGNEIEIYVDRRHAPDGARFWNGRWFQPYENGENVEPRRPSLEDIISVACEQVSDGGRLEGVGS